MISCGYAQTREHLHRIQRANLKIPKIFERSEKNLDDPRCCLRERPLLSLSSEVPRGGELDGLPDFSAASTRHSEFMTGFHSNASATRRHHVQLENV